MRCRSWPILILHSCHIEVQTDEAKMHWDLLNASGLVRSQDIRRKHENYTMLMNLGQLHYGAYGTLIQPTKV